MRLSCSRTREVNRLASRRKTLYGVCEPTSEVVARGSAPPPPWTGRVRQGKTDSGDAPVIAHPAGLRGFDLRCSVTDVFHALKVGRSGPEDACIPSGKLRKVVGQMPNAAPVPRYPQGHAAGT